MRAASRPRPELRLRSRDGQRSAFRVACARRSNGRRRPWHGARSSRRSCRRRRTSPASHAPFPWRCAAPATRRRIESRQRLLRRAFAGYLMKVPDQLPNLGHRAMPLQVAARSHAFGEVEPKFGVRHRFPPRPPSTPFSSHMLASTARRSSPSSRRSPAPPDKRGTLRRGGSSPAHIRADRRASARPPTTPCKTDGKAGHTSRCARPVARRIPQYS
jgi:hypothetical protein